MRVIFYIVCAALYIAFFWLFSACGDWTPEERPNPPLPDLEGHYSVEGTLVEDTCDLGGESGTSEIYLSDLGADGWALFDLPTIGNTGTYVLSDTPERFEVNEFFWNWCWYTIDKVYDHIYVTGFIETTITYDCDEDVAQTCVLRWDTEGWKVLDE